MKKGGEVKDGREGPTTPKPPKKTNNSPKAPEDPPIKKAPFPPMDPEPVPEMFTHKKGPRRVTSETRKTETDSEPGEERDPKW
jgi:hypothetical protein